VKGIKHCNIKVGFKWFQALVEVLFFVCGTFMFGVKYPVVGKRDFYFDRRAL